MPKVSIIVPVYNAEKYLHRCVDSILAQTLTDWECILVDDGSPDGSGAICDAYARQDKRVRVVHKENGGVSSARNLALQSVEGTWLAFLDSDDALYPNALQTMIDGAEQNHLDLIQCHFNREYEEGQVVAEATDVLTASQYAATENYLTCVTGGVFKTAIVRLHSLRFDTTVRLGEDQIFLLNYMRHCSRAQRIGDVLYFYRDNESSAVNNPKPEYEMASVRAFKELKRNNPIASKRCDAMLLSWFVSLILTSKTPVSVLSELYKDVHFEYISPRANSVERMAFHLKKVSTLFTIVLLRTIYCIKKLCRK